jgi:hypothetical protein
MVSPEIQKDLRKYVDENLVPDIMKYLAKLIPRIEDIPTERYPLRRLIFRSWLMDPEVNEELQENLNKTEDILCLPFEHYYKINGKKSVRAAIRVSKAIGAPEHADTINQIMKDRLVPY